MRKIAVTIFMAMAFLLMSSAIMAETGARYYTVKKGDCLSVIGSKLCVSWREIARINKIKNPDIIYPGQKFVIPEKITKKQEQKKVQVKEITKILPVQTEPMLEKSIFVSLLDKSKKQKAVIPAESVPSKIAKVELLEGKDEKTETTTFLNRFDFYLGGGAYESVHENAQGWYAWGKARYRPFEFDLGDNSYARVGIFAFGALGEGNDRNYNYDWEKWAIGPTVKFLGSHWDSDLDVGFGKLYNKGGEDLYRSEQIDDIFLLSAHLNLYPRRDAKKKWFPKIDLNFELTMPYSTRHEHTWNDQVLASDSNDNRSIELFLNQSIYDIDLEKHLRLTPGFNFGIGHNYGLDQSFYQLGPSATLSWHNEDIISISFLNYREMINGDGDEWHWIGGYLNLGGIYKAYKASRIKEATEKDLKS